MKCEIALLWTLTATPFVNAGNLPDILWRTNAHNNIVLSVVFAPDSVSLFSGSGTAKQWRVSDTNLLRTFLIPGEDIGAIAVSPDGTRLVGLGPTRGFRMWRVADGAVLYSSIASGSCLTFSLTGEFLAAGSRNSVSILTVSGGSITGGTTHDEIYSQQVNAVAFSPDGVLLVSGSGDSTAKLMRVSDGTVLQAFSHAFQVRSVAFAPISKVIASGTLSGDVRLWSTNGSLLHVLPTGGPTVAMDFSPDGKLLATTSEGLVHFWRVADGAHLLNYDSDPAGMASAVDISPDGKLFAYGTGIGAVVVARMPALITETQRVGNAAVVCWQGGTGRYQLQMRTNLNVGAWQDLGSVTTNLCATNIIASTNAFFRVLSLPNP